MVVVEENSSSDSVAKDTKSQLYSLSTPNLLWAVHREDAFPRKDRAALTACSTSSMDNSVAEIKTHGSELQGQERAKRIAKSKTRDELLCVFIDSIILKRLGLETEFAC